MQFGGAGAPSGAEGGASAASEETSLPDPTMHEDVSKEQAIEGVRQDTHPLKPIFTESILREADGRVSWLAHRGRKLRRAGSIFDIENVEEEREPALRPFPLRQQLNTEAPADYVSPDPALVEEVEALESYQQLFRRNIRKMEEAVHRAGVIEDAAAAGEDTGARYPKPVVLQMRDYSALATKVFEAGFTFVVDGDGKPHIATLEPIDMGPEGMDTHGIIDAAREMGCTDEDSLFTLQFGARSHSNPPKVSVYYPNHGGAREHAAQLDELLEKEMEKGWVVKSQTPPFIPVGVRPVSVVPKLKEQDGMIVIRGFRLVTDASFPRKGRPGAVDEDGKWLAPNLNYDEHSQPWLKFPAIWDLVLAAVPLLALTLVAGVQLVGATMDFEKWFRQIPMAMIDRWQIIEAWRGSFLHDVRVTMGCVHSSNTAQRIAWILLDLVNQRLDETVEWALRQTPESFQRAAHEWRERRKAVFTDPRQWRVWFIGSYQDDSPIKVPAPLAKWVGDTFKEVMARFRVPVAEKVLEFAEVFEAIGGRFYLAQERACVGPTAATMVKLEEALRALRAAAAERGSMMRMKEFESVTGLMEWAGYFLPDGPRLCHQAHQCKRRAKRQWGRQAQNVIVSDGLLEACDSMVSRLTAGEFRPWTADPVWWHGGVEVAADAATVGGWGLHVGGLCAAGQWEEETLRAIENSRTKRKDRERVSISPLELLAQALLLAVVGLACGRVGNGQVVMRCDNQAAVDVVASRRPKSPAMRLALEKLEEIERLFGLKAKLEFIGTKENVLADALSRGAEEIVGEVLGQRGRERRSFDMSTSLGAMTLECFAVQAEREIRGALLNRDVE